MKCKTKICPGELRTKIVVQKPMAVSDGQGGQKPTEWVELFWFYGKVEWKKGFEKVNAERVQASTYCKITTYYDERFDASYRLLFNGKILNIRDVTDVDEVHLVSEVTAEEGVGT